MQGHFIARDCRDGKGEKKTEPEKWFDMVVKSEDYPCLSSFAQEPGNGLRREPVAISERNISVSPPVKSFW